MKLDYGTLLSPYPIKLSIGTLLKPTLGQIANELSFDKFNYFETLLKLTPEIFYNHFKGDGGVEYWNSLTGEKQNELVLYDIVVDDRQLSNTYVELFNFFFDEDVVFSEGYFVLLKKGETLEQASAENIKGVISRETFIDILEIIQQTCCIYSKKSEEEKPKFKNEFTRKLYEKMQKAAKEREMAKKSDLNFTLPNIISSVSNRHQTINPLNVWDLTVFQLLDSFNRTQVNEMYDIDSTRVSVWGDEKKTFQANLWYKNEHDR